MTSKEHAHRDDKVTAKQRPPQPEAHNFETLDQQTHPATIIQQARLGPGSLSLREVLQLQHTIGNRAVGKLFAGLGQRHVIQPKLTVGPVGDKYEQEADRVAQQVVNMPDARRGEYNPQSRGGQEAIAHELAHVVPPGPGQGQGLAQGKIIQRTPAAVAAAAGRAPAGNLRICHQAVCYWLRRGGIFSARRYRAMTSGGQELATLDGVLAGAAASTRNGVANIPRGHIVGLYDGATLQHSLVSVGGGRFAGLNNLGMTRFRRNADGTWPAEPPLGNVADIALGSYVYDATLSMTEALPGGWGAKWNAAGTQIRANRGMGQQFYWYTVRHVDPTVLQHRGHCYITTACVESRGLLDDCEELTVLRTFRDTYMLKKANGRQLLDIYYRHSPRIVEAIAEQENAPSIYDHLYEVICACVEAIKRGDNEFAYNTYCEMVIKLGEQYLPDTV